MTTLAQKIIANACNKSEVEPGEVVVCTVDLAMIHDSGGPRRVKPILEKLNRKVWNNEKVVVVTDHYVPIDSEEKRANQELTKKWVNDQDIQNFYDKQGICQVVIPEKGNHKRRMISDEGERNSHIRGA